MASLVSVSFQAPACLSSPPSLSFRSSKRGCYGGLQVALGPRSPAPLRLRTVAMATPPTDIGDKLSKSIKEAEELCAAENSSGECAAAWDEVEELSAEIAHKRAQSAENKDPLEKFCKEVPEADECRVYED